MEQLIHEIASFVPYNEQEKQDQALILNALETCPDIFDRGNPTMHMTASAWVVNPDRTRVLMAYHNQYDSWAWLGGHADGERDLLTVALREVREESGLTRVRPVTEGIFSLEIMPVSGHEKRGEYISSHLHLNVTYLLEADDRLSLTVKADENSAVAWMTPEEAIARSSEPWFRERIYHKLNEKLRLYVSREQKRQEEAE